MKRIKYIAVLLSVFMLSSCAAREGGGEYSETMTVSLTEEAVPEETAGTDKKGFLGDYTETAAVTEAETAAEAREGYVLIGGKEYIFDGRELILEPFEELTDEFIEDIKSVSPEKITVYPENIPQDAEAELFMREFPECEITYMQSHNAYVPPEEGYKFAVNPVVEVYDNGDSRWQNEKRYICADFSNYFRTPVTVTAARLFYCRNGGNGGLEQVPFRNGEYDLPLDIPVEAEHICGVSDGYDLIITEEDFDYENAESGLYLLVIDFGDVSSETFIFINKFGGRRIITDNIPDFLSEEQAAALKNAFDEVWENVRAECHITAEYAQTRSFEELIEERFPDLTYSCAFRLAYENGMVNESGELLETWSDWPGSVTYAGSLLLPVYSNENEVMLKNLRVFYHSDSPYFVSYDISSCRLLNTENGWKVDVLPDIY